jgi:hypothetical protein
LDDLIFTYYIIIKYRKSELQLLLPSLRNEIETLTERVYGRTFSIYCLIKAWLLRKYCPYNLIYGYEYVKNDPLWSLEEWVLCKRITINDETKILLRLYHTDNFRGMYDQKIRINMTNIFSSPREFDLLQNVMQELLYKKGIILEVPPTSNVRISYYKEYKEHHIWRWLGIKDGKREQKNPISPIVLGTDDPGIFATNIYNEYCHIYNSMIYDAKLSQSEAIQVIKEIDANSRNYSFKV